MSLAVAIQMDPLETVDIDGDSTLRAGARGADAAATGSTTICRASSATATGRIVATARPFEVRRERGNHVSFGAPETHRPRAPWTWS